MNKEFRIFNLSKSGDGPLRQLVTLEEIGFDLDPDLAIFFPHIPIFYQVSFWMILFPWLSS